MSVVAWRILLLTRLSRTEPKKSCEQVLASHEWKALYCKMNKTNEIPSKPPTLGEATTWIARLGGYLARKNDGPPGPTVIWRGWQRMQDYADAFLIFQPP
jgi:Transposase Tn5 dimerisation domain